jgi:nucleotide-binding universal stress UspA family protein
MILIAYDGSDDAKFAIDRAGELFTGSDAAVGSVREPFIDVLLASVSSAVIQHTDRPVVLVPSPEIAE